MPKKCPSQIYKQWKSNLYASWKCFMYENSELSCWNYNSSQCKIPSSVEQWAIIYSCGIKTDLRIDPNSILYPGTSADRMIMLFRVGWFVGQWFDLSYCLLLTLLDLFFITFHEHTSRRNCVPSECFFGVVSHYFVDPLLDFGWLCP